MLKKISVDQLRLGMHLHEVCGPWLDHPFWTQRFVVRDPQDLARLRSSGASECLIDTTKGVDVLVPAPASAPPPVVEAAGAPAAPDLQATSLEAEAARAAQLCTQARHTVVALFDDARMGRALQVSGCAPLVDQIAGSMQRNAGAMLGMVRLKSHDDYTFMHSVAVCTLMMGLARQMGQGEEQVREAGLAGLLHDVGKANIALSVLNKPGKLSAEEFALVKRHPRDGHDMLLDTEAPSATALDVCLHHHERPDGKGYPDGLSGAAFSLAGAHGRGVRCLRRDHLQPTLQAGLGAGRVGRQDGGVDAAGQVRRHGVPRLRRLHRHLPGGLAGEAAVAAPGGGGRTMSRPAHRAAC